MRRAAVLLLSLFALLLGTARAQEPLPVPALSARVIDQTGTLQSAQRAALEAKLEQFERAAGPQIVVLLVPTTQPEDIAAFAQRVADSWKIGRRDVGDGLLIVVDMGAHRIRIEVAKALEGAVPDLAARQVIANAIAPAFKKGDYAGGLNAGVDQLMARIKGEGLAAPQKRGGSGLGDGFDWQELAMFFFVGVPIIGAVLTGIFGRKLGSLATGGAAGAMAWWFSASLLVAAAAGLVALLLVGVIGIGAAGRSIGRRGSSTQGGPPVIWGGGGGGWSGGDGGGFSSGGGGDFGGGGASGDW